MSAANHGQLSEADSSTMEAGLSKDTSSVGSEDAGSDASQDGGSKRPYSRGSTDSPQNFSVSGQEEEPLSKRLKSYESSDGDVQTNGLSMEEDDKSLQNEDLTTKSLGNKTDSSGSIDNLVSNSSRSDSPSLDKDKLVDSDKENMEEIPMDLTVKVSCKSPDLIQSLVEEEEEECGRGILSERQKRRARLVRRLQEELRNEEAKLVLLKKIRQSQLVQHLQDPAQLTAASAQQGKVLQPGMRPQHPQPPPLVRGPGPNIPGKPGSTSSQQLSRPPGSTSSQSQGPPPLVMAPGRSVNNTLSAHNGRTGTPTNLHRSLQSGSRTSTPPQPQQPEQTPAQRQAAAKLALRKQLEKTLLQIPPPKPPPPEMNFIPSLVGNEFIMLVGLEEVVKHITDTNARAKGEKTEVKYVFNPFTCVQCNTDFTPVWKRDRPGSRSVICETCVTSNQKKALKQEHTNRLKSAFVKALQQEQEIEQRMQQQQQQQAAQQKVQQEQSRQREKDRERERESSRERERERDRDRDRDRDRERERETRELAAQQAAHMSALTAHHAMAAAAAAGLNLASPLNLTSAGLKPTQEQIRQHQNLLQAHQAQLRAPPGMAFNPRAMFPFMPNLAKADLQRQYLLDMIPRSLPGGSSLWKS